MFILVHTMEIGQDSQRRHGSIVEQQGGFKESISWGPCWIWVHHNIWSDGWSLWRLTWGTWRSSWCCRDRGRACTPSPYRYHPQREEGSHIWSRTPLKYFRRPSIFLDSYKWQLWGSGNLWALPEGVNVRGDGVKSHPVQLGSLYQELEEKTAVSLK